MTENQFSPITGVNDRAVKHDQGKLITADRTELAWQDWTPPAAQGVIVVVHGLAEHSGRYRETAEYLAHHGWAVIAADLRGHGQSADGSHSGRVHVDEFSDYFHDVDAMVNWPEKTRWLAAGPAGTLHGPDCLVLCAGKTAGLHGAIISSPALGTHPASQPPLLLKLVVQVLSRLAPRLLFKSDLDTGAISRDPEVVQAYIDDPLVSKKVSARWYTSMMKAMDHAFDRAHSLCVPLLLMQSRRSIGRSRCYHPLGCRRAGGAPRPGHLGRVLPRDAQRTWQRPGARKNTQLVGTALFKVRGR
jgi:alpha-beta hydrolase superfamily lysophospholipase